MACMKCGREIPPTQVFCDECLKEMEKYPVKPGTPINLPNRSAVPPLRRRRFRPARREAERIVSLRRAVVWLSVVCILLLGALALSVLANLQLLGFPDIHILPEFISEAVGSMCFT